MKKSQLNNKGFGLIAILIIIVVLAVVGGAGAYVYHKNHKAKTTTTATGGTKSNSSADTTKPPVQTTPAHTSADALKVVQTTYTTALAHVKQTTSAGQGEIDAVKSYLSASLYAKLSANAGSGHDQILCGQMRPDSFTTSLGTTASGVTTVFVNELYGSTPVKVLTTVDLSSLKLTSITCPQ